MRLGFVRSWFKLVVRSWLIGRFWFRMVIGFVFGLRFITRLWFVPRLLLVMRFWFIMRFRMRCWFGRWRMTVCWSLWRRIFFPCFRLDINCYWCLWASIFILGILSRPLLILLLDLFILMIRMWPLLPAPPGQTWSSLRTRSLAQFWCQTAQTTPE